MMKQGLSRPKLLKTQISILLVKGMKIEDPLEDFQSKLSDTFNTFYLQDEIEGELYDILFEERMDDVVLIQDSYDQE